MKKNTILLFTCMLLLTACGNSKTEGENNADEIATFKEWFENKYNGKFVYDDATCVTSEEFPFQLKGSLVRKGNELWESIRHFEFYNLEQARRKLQKNGIDDFGRKLFKSEFEREARFKAMASKYKSGGDSIATIYTVKYHIPNSLDGPRYGQILFIYNKSDKKKPISWISINDNIMKGVAAVDMAMQDSLFLGDMDFERLHREATNPIIKAIYAPLPSE